MNLCCISAHEDGVIISRCTMLDVPVGETIEFEGKVYTCIARGVCEGCKHMYAPLCTKVTCAYILKDSISVIFKEVVK